MFTKDATPHRPSALRELTDNEMPAVTGGDGSTTSGTADGSSDGTDLKTGRRQHALIIVSSGG